MKEANLFYGDLKIGLPWHGKIKTNGQLELPDSSLKTGDWQAAPLTLIAFSGLPTPTTTDEETAAGMVWRDYALLQGQYEKYFAGAVDCKIPHNSWVMKATDGTVWLMRLVIDSFPSSILTASASVSLGFHITKQKFGVFGEAIAAVTTLYTGTMAFTMPSLTIPGEAIYVSGVYVTPSKTGRRIAVEVIANTWSPDSMNDVMTFPSARSALVISPPRLIAVHEIVLNGTPSVSSVTLVSTASEIYSVSESGTLGHMWGTGESSSTSYSGSPPTSEFPDLVQTVTTSSWPTDVGTYSYSKEINFLLHVGYTLSETLVKFKYKYEVSRSVAISGSGVAVYDNGPGLTSGSPTIYWSSSVHDYYWHSTTTAIYKLYRDATLVDSHTVVFDENTESHQSGVTSSGPNAPTSSGTSSVTDEGAVVTPTGSYSYYTKNGIDIDSSGAINVAIGSAVRDGWGQPIPGGIVQLVRSNYGNTLQKVKKVVSADDVVSITETAIGTGAKYQQVTGEWSLGSYNGYNGFA